jgi:Ser/Thr protein kinase RdoA (MazF antagonist)
LLRAIPGEIARCGATWQVPEGVPTTEGDAIATSEDGIWRLTRHLPGEELDMHEPDSYSSLARMLAELHAVLEGVPEALKVCERGTVEQARELAEDYHGGSFAAATEHPSERDIVRAIAGWVGPRLDELEALPRHLTHGDWTPRNLKVSPKGWGLLDWEFARIDPVVMDLQQSCCTLLMWSGLSRPDERIERLVEDYSKQRRQAVSLASVRTAMALYWLRNYDHWRARQAVTGRFEQVLARQPERLRVVGEFVGAL